MELTNISIGPLLKEKLCLLGYGNQGRAHALNLRDSGVSVTVAAREGGIAWKQAEFDQFNVQPISEAVSNCSVLIVLLPDEVAGEVLDSLDCGLEEKRVGFAHGYAYHFETFRRPKHDNFFLVGPKGAGSVLRDEFRQKRGLPMVFAVGSKADNPTREICLAYAKAVGAYQLLHETSFQEETECDLFGEQAVLCGGLLELMEHATETLVRQGHSEEMAFMECCYEVKTIMDLLLKFGPEQMSRKISPTAMYGGLTRGKRLIGAAAVEQMQLIFNEIRSGDFHKEWMKEARHGKKSIKDEIERRSNTTLQKAFKKVQSRLTSSEGE